MAENFREDFDNEELIEYLSEDYGNAVQKVIKKFEINGKTFKALTEERLKEIGPGIKEKDVVSLLELIAKLKLCDSEERPYHETSIVSILSDC